MSNVAGALDSIDEKAIRINQKEESRVGGAQTARESEMARLRRLDIKRHKAGQKRWNKTAIRTAAGCGIGGWWTRLPLFQSDWLSRNCQEN
jgi:hypothetical protein